MLFDEDVPEREQVYQWIDTCPTHEFQVLEEDEKHITLLIVLHKEEEEV